MDKEIIKELVKPERKDLRKIISKTPAWVRYLLVGLIFTATVLIGGSKMHIIIFNKDILKNIRSNFSINFLSNSNQTILSVQAENPKKCPADFCNFFQNFKDDTEWTNKQSFTVIRENPLLLEASSSALSPGAIVNYNVSVSNFILRLLVTPLASPSANLSISYGTLYRCIIGDGGYREIGCQINKDYPHKPERWVYVNSDGEEMGKSLQQYSPWNINEDLNIKFSYTRTNSEGVIEIQVNSNNPVNWKLKSNQVRKSQKENIGIGLIDPNLKHNIQAIFKSFMLDVNNI